MITHYYRPPTLEKALKLLSQPDTIPLGGGTVLARQNESSFSVVDLQTLGMDKIHKSGNNLKIGATVTLQAMLESAYVPEALKLAIERDAPINLRTMETIAGALVTCNGSSPLGASMLAMDAKMFFAPGGTQIMLGNYFPLRAAAGFKPGVLITEVEIPVNVRLAFDAIARTPGDTPIVCAALAQWSSGRTRLALGGWGPVPTLAMDGNDPSGLEEAARNAFAEASDAWASAEYRSEIAAVLVKRCMEK